MRLIILKHYSMYHKKKPSLQKIWDQQSDSCTLSGPCKRPVSIWGFRPRNKRKIPELNALQLWGHYDWNGSGVEHGRPGAPWQFPNLDDCELHVHMMWNERCSPSMAILQKLTHVLPTSLDINRTVAGQEWKFYVRRIVATLHFQSGPSWKVSFPRHNFTN